MTARLILTLAAILLLAPGSTSLPAASQDIYIPGPGRTQVGGIEVSIPVKHFGM